MQLYLDKLAAVAKHFDDGDSHLGFRKLVDCVLDTQDKNFYKQCISLTEWKEAAPRSEADLKERAMELIQQLSTAQFEIITDHVPLLEVKQLFKTYARGRFSLGEIDMTIHRGEVWGLVGENGNGKTTLLRILAKDLKYDRGELQFWVDDQPMADYDLRTKLTYIPQRTPKWYGSLKSNLKYAAAHYGIKGEENELTVLMWIIRFGLWNFRNHNWDELSSGYKMRFELARTFLRAPKLLLLDEPLANLDVLAQQLVLEDLRNLSMSLSNPLGIILSSQQLFEVEKISDNVLFLKKGVPTQLDLINSASDQLTVVELEIHSSRELLNQALAAFEVEDLKFNGGSYVISIRRENGMSELLTSLIAAGIHIQYVRDISQSTRRLFL